MQLLISAVRSTKGPGGQNQFREERDRAWHRIEAVPRILCISSVDARHIDHDTPGNSAKLDSERAQNRKIGRPFFTWSGCLARTKLKLSMLEGSVAEERIGGHWAAPTDPLRRLVVRFGYCNVAGTEIVWLNEPDVAFSVKVNAPVTVCSSVSALVLAELCSSPAYFAVIE